MNHRERFYTALDLKEPDFVPLTDPGLDGLHPIEPGPMDLADVKARYVLPYGNEDEVRKDVRRCIDTAAKGGGFILASSNSIHSNVKVDNIYTMADEARKYGKYPLGH